MGSAATLINMQKTNIPFVSVLLPVLNEAAFIDACLHSIVENNYPLQDLEILIFDGGSTDDTCRKIQLWVAKFPQISLHENKYKYVSYALNMGIEMAKGQYIIRIDAHCIYPKNYFKTLIDAARSTKAQNVGCIWLTAPRKENAAGWAICSALTHPLGIGNALYRLPNVQSQFVDTVPFGCFPKETFSRYGQFDNRLIRNQDYEYNRRITAQGGKIYLVSSIFATYFARSDWRSFWKNNFQNGLWVVYTIKLTGNTKSMHLRHFAPILPILGTLSIIFSNFWVNILLPISMALMLMYVLILLFASISASFKYKSTFIHIWFAFTSLHFAYGFGLLMGIFTKPPSK